MKEKRFFLSALVMLFFGLCLLFLYNKSISFEKDETLKKQMDALLLTLHNKIEETTHVSLASSVILAKSPHVIGCLQNQDRTLPGNAVYQPARQSDRLAQPSGFENPG